MRTLTGRGGSVRGRVAAAAITVMMLMAISLPAMAVKVDPARIDLGITKTDTQDPVLPGVPFEYVLDYVNDGPSLARDVWIVDTLPPEISYQSDASGCSHAAGVVSCSIGMLDAGIGGQIRLTVTANAGVVGTFINNAKIEERWVLTPVEDFNPANDQDDEDTTVLAPPPGSIGDFVWLDADGNAVQDAGELGIGGVTVNLTGPSGPLSKVTGVDGKYLFTDLPAGDYVVTVDAATGPAGHTLSTPGAVNVALAAGAAFLDADYGLVPPPPSGSIGDFVWLDVNGDAVQDAGELGIGGVTVNLTGPSGPLSKVTGADGKYLFTDLPAGAYVVTVDATTGPAGHTLSTPAAVNLALAAGAAFLDADYGLVPPPPSGSIGDFVWNDLNRDGVQDAGEPGIAGVKATLTGPGGTVTATTGAGGLYLFSGLAGGDYSVSIDLTTAPAGFTGTTPAAHPVTLGANQAYVLADFGLATPPVTPMIDLELTKDVAPAAVTVGGQAVFTITLTNKGPADATGVVVGDVLPSGVTFVSSPQVTGGGLWTVGSLAAGASVSATMTVSVNQAGAFTNVAEVTAADQPDVDSTPGDGQGDDWDDATVNAAAVLASGSIGDTVWLDINGNEVQDSGEPGISGATVVLTSSGCSSGAACITHTATTAADGKYLIAALDADTYTVKVNTASVADNLSLTTPGSVTVNLADGATYLLADFGFTEVLPKTGMDTQPLVAMAIVLLALGVLLAAPRGRFTD